VLLEPRTDEFQHLDDETRRQLRAIVDFFESRGLARLRADDHDHRWYGDFLEMVGREGIFATFGTPGAVGGPAARWDTARIIALNEVLAFYSLAHWYAWQVTVLGLGPIWMSPNEAARQRAAALLREGAVFGFGLSERTHGADIYATDMVLTPDGSGGWRANGEKYYIGNGNVAGLLSVFGRFADTDEYVFFLAEPSHEAYELVDNVVDATVTFARDPVDGRFLLRAEIRVSLPGIDRRIAAELVRNTERICPYAKMFRQGIEHVVALAPYETSPDPLRNP